MRNPFSILKVKRVIKQTAPEPKNPYFTVDDIVASSQYLSLQFVMQQLKKLSPGLDVVKVQRDGQYSILKERYASNRLLFYRWLVHLAQGPKIDTYTIDTIIFQGWEPLNKAEIDRRNQIKNQDLWPEAYASAIKEKPIFSEGITLIGHRYLGKFRIPFTSEVALEASLEAHYSFREGKRVLQFGKISIDPYSPNILTESPVQDWLNDNLSKSTITRVHKGQIYLEPVSRQPS